MRTDDNVFFTTEGLGNLNFSFTINRRLGGESRGHGLDVNSHPYTHLFEPLISTSWRCLGGQEVFEEWGFSSGSWWVTGKGRASWSWLLPGHS